MNGTPQPQPSLCGPAHSADELNEHLLQDAYQHLLAAQTREEQMRWWVRLSHYVGKRSPERIRQMERERGLA